MAVAILEESLQVLNAFGQFGEELSLDGVVLGLLLADLLVDIAYLGGDELDLIPGLVEQDVVVGVVAFDVEQLEPQQRDQRDGTNEHNHLHLVFGVQLGQQLLGMLYPQQVHTSR